jgi:hypothetical protein
MRYALPIVFVALLALFFATAPHLEPRVLRLRARRVAEDLRARHGFREGSKAAWIGVTATGWPPFHYGARKASDGELIGSLYGLPVRVAGYEVVTSGSRHRYGLAVVALPRPLDWFEVRGEPPFSAARVPEHVPDGRMLLGVADFDVHWSVYAETSDARAVAGSRRLVETMLDAPGRLNFRVHDSELLLWIRDGWSTAAELMVCLGAVIGLLGLPDRSDV